MVGAQLSLSSPAFSPTIYPDSLWTLSVVAGDINGDQHVDVFQGVRGGQNRLLLNNGDGSFTPQALEGSSWTSGAVFADFDGDGALDIFVCNTSRNHVILRAPAFDVWRSIPMPTDNRWDDTRECTGADMDGDGKIDIIVAIYGYDNKIYFNKGNGYFNYTEVDSPASTVNNRHSSDVKAADLDKDGDIDLVFSQTGQNNPYIAWNNGDNTTYMIQSLTSCGAWGVNIEDMDKDDHLDIIVACAGGPGAQKVMIYYNSGQGTFPSTASYVPYGLSGRRSYELGIADFNGDNLPDIYAPNYDAGQDTLIINNGNRTFTSYDSGIQRQNDWVIDVADFDGDNKLDVVLGMDGSQANGIALLFNQGVVPPVAQTTTTTTTTTVAATTTTTTTTTTVPPATTTTTTTTVPPAASGLNWEITLPDPTNEDDVVVDFSTRSGVNPLPEDVAAGAEGVITTKYSATAASTSAKLETFMVKGACDASSSWNGTKIPSNGTCSETTEPLATACTYRFKKTGFGDAFNLDTTGTKPILSMCEVAQLKLDTLVIEQRFTNIEVKFETAASFNVTSIVLESAQIEDIEKDTSLAGYITAGNCPGSANADSIIAPNEELCVEISSNSSDVEIKNITSMTIAGNVAAGNEQLDVVNNDVAEYSAITSIGSRPSQNVQVFTRIPPNIFNFEADGAKIEISGSVIVEFAEGTERRLSVDTHRLLQAAGEEETAEFNLNIILAPEPELAFEGEDNAMMAMMNSAKAIAGKALAILGMIVVSAFALW